MKRTIALSLGTLSMLACTFATVPGVPPTPPAPPPTTAAPSPTSTATLRPTAMTAPTFTPQGGLIATPMQAAPGGGSYGFGSTGGGGTSPQQPQPTRAPASGGVAPIGVRETPTLGGGASASISVQLGGSGASAVTPATPSSPLTPTVPPRAFDSHAQTVSAGGTLVITYDITLTAGQVILWAVAPSGGVVWQQGFSESATAEAEIPVSEGGAYTVHAYAENFSGMYQLGYAAR